MRMANVVSVRDVTPEEHRPEAPGLTRRERIAALLRRYPETEEAENAEILKFLKTGPHLDVGLLGSDDQVREKIHAFRSAYAGEFRLKRHEVALFLAATLGPAGFLAANYLLR